MKILVAGAAGFIGMNLVTQLLELGHEVVGLDNYYTGQHRNTVMLQRASNSYKFYEADILQLPEMPDKFDVIINLACPASPPKYQADPIYTARVNFEGTLNLLNLSHRHSARFLQASTSEIYGDPKVSPQSEDYLGNVNCIGPRSCYDEGKRIAETLCNDFRQHKGADVRIFRIFNTYGPFMDPADGRVVSNFVNQMLSGADVTVYGSGEQTRSFLYIDDLVDGILKVMNTTDFEGPINLGSDFEFTINELLSTLSKLIGKSNFNIVYHDKPTDDPMQRRANYFRATRKLGWEPQTSLNDGLQQTIKYFTELKAVQ